MDKLNTVLSVILFLLLLFMLYRRWQRRQNTNANIEKGHAFLEENAKKEGVTVTESGLQYLVLEEGTGALNPKSTSTVKVHYHGTLIDGSIFDSSVDRGEPISFRLNQVIKGWREGLQYMVEGQKVRLFIPYHLAYGRRRARTIPAASTLIFDVELLEVK